MTSRPPPSPSAAGGASPAATEPADDATTTAGTRRIDVLVVGAGPAGCVAAGLLARRGHTVWLVDDARGRPGAPLETLLPAALNAMARCGLGEVVRKLTRPDDRRHAARWDDDQLLARPQEPAAHRGVCLARPAFEHGLRSWAADCGATIVAGRARPDAGQWLIEGAADASRVEARVTLAATGRQATAAMLPTDVVARGPETAAFAIVDAAAAGAAGGSDQAVVEATADGWCWWIGAPGVGATAVVCVDAAEVVARGSADLIDAVLGATVGPARQLRGKDVSYAVRATPRLLRTDAPVLLVGDAAATLDPLASQGTEKALVGGEHAALCAATALARPELGALALECHARWERDLWFAHRDTAAQFYGRVQRFAALPFWVGRRAAPTAAPPSRLVVRDDLERRPAMHRRGDELVVEAGVAAPGLPGLARIGHVPVVPLIDAFATASEREHAVRRAGQHHSLFALGPPLVHAAVAELWRRGYLRAAP